MSALIWFPTALVVTLVHVGIRWPAWAAFSGFVAGWWFPDFLKALFP